MTTKIEAEQAAEQLPELLLRIQNGERFLIEREGNPIAAIIPADDLQEPAMQGTDEREAEEAFLRTMEERGLITRPKNPQLFVPFDQRPLIRVKGKPLSETIIEERDRC